MLISPAVACNELNSLDEAMQNMTPDGLVNWNKLSAVGAIVSSFSFLLSTSVSPFFQPSLLSSLFSPLVSSQIWDVLKFSTPYHYEKNLPLQKFLSSTKVWSGDSTMYAIASLRENDQQRRHASDRVGSPHLRVASLSTLNLTGLEPRQVETILIGPAASVFALMR